MNWTVSKTVVGATPPWVRIPPSPPASPPGFEPLTISRADFLQSSLTAGTRPSACAAVSPHELNSTQELPSLTNERAFVSESRLCVCRRPIPETQVAVAAEPGKEFRSRIESLQLDPYAPGGEATRGGLESLSTFDPEVSDERPPCSPRLADGKRVLEQGEGQERRRITALGIERRPRGWLDNVAQHWNLEPESRDEVPLSLIEAATILADEEVVHEILAGATAGLNLGPHPDRAAR